MGSRGSCLVAMSGGVDSSVCAALLLKKGYSVIGVTLSLFDGDRAENTIKDAEMVAKHLSIEHRVLDLRECFKNEVISPFISEYEKGRTPNPCITCNRKIKLGALFDYTKEQGIDYIATGHYARAGYSEKYGRYVLSESVTKEKDQTYFLYHLDENKLSSLLLPLGEYNKEQIRGLAEEFSLPVAKKRDSQEICFIPNDDYISFIRPKVKTGMQEGRFVNTKGQEIGRHKGLIYYTVGQRKGLGAFGKPMFVKEIRPQENEIVLCEKGEEFSSCLTADNLTFSAIDPPKEPMKIMAKIRYKAPPAPAALYPAENRTAKIEFDNPQRAITPGQAVVFYENGVVLGGGTINSGGKI